MAQEFDMQAMMGATAPKGMSPLDQALTDLHNAISSLRVNIDKHTEKVSPVLNSYPQPDNPGMAQQTEDKSLSSTVVSSIREAVDQIENLQNRVNSLTYRLDV
jgi:RNA polymerase-binding transcription factor DksA